MRYAKPRLDPIGICVRLCRHSKLHNDGIRPLAFRMGRNRLLDRIRTYRRAWQGLALALLLAACNESSSPTPPVPPAPPVPFSEWDITYSTGTPPTMAKQPDGTFTVDIPQDPGSIHYVTTTAPALGAAITLTFGIQGTGTVIPIPTADTPPAMIRLYMQRKGDNMSGQGQYEFYRWWSSAHVAITNPG